MNRTHRKNWIKYALTTLGVIALVWTVLTIYVELDGPSKEWNFGNGEREKVLIVFDPDPFYNLDEMVCLSFAKALAEKQVSVKVVTVAAAERVDENQYHAFVYCANTYNWRPDWAISGYIERNHPKSNSKVIAITLGAGSTEASQRNFETVIQRAGGKPIKSYSLWLWRPNDEAKMERPNVEVAVGMAYDWGIEIGTILNADH